MLEITNAFKTFYTGTPNETAALDGINLKIDKGDFVVLIGTNGSGKSTLQNIISGTEKLDSGSIKIKNQDISSWSESKRASLIGRVFQDPFLGTAPGMTIAENFALASQRGMKRGLGWLLKPSLRKEIKERVSKLQLGLENRLNTQVGTLSGGQRQALTLLMASWIKPDFFMLDEHTAALDPKSAEKIIKLTCEIVEADQLTTLMVTHSMHQAANIGTRLIMMHKGKIVKDFSGDDKKRLRADDLLKMFEELRQQELLDEAAAAILRTDYN